MAKKDIEILNYDETKREIVSDFDHASFYFDYQENEKQEVGFEISRTKNNNDIYDLITYENTIVYDGQKYIIKNLSESAEGDNTSKQVTAVHISFTIQDKRQYNTLTGTLSINQCLTHVFGRAQGFTYDVNNVNGAFTRVEQENFGNSDCKSLIEEVIADYDAIVLRNNKHFTFIPRQYVGEKVEEQIRYKYNTDSVSFDIDTFELKTQIKGMGKRKDPVGSQEQGDYYFTPITYTSPESAKWGIRIQDPIEDDRYTVAANMRQRLITELKDKPDISGSVALKKFIGIKLYDRVRFVYEPLNINEFIRVVGIRTRPFIDDIPEITLENNQSTINKYLVQLSKKRSGV